VRHADSEYEVINGSWLLVYLVILKLSYDRVCGSRFWDSTTRKFLMALSHSPLVGLRFKDRPSRSLSLTYGLDRYMHTLPIDTYSKTVPLEGFLTR
jgi:hypothetical protein